MSFSSTWGSASTNPQDQDDAPPPVGKHSVSLDDARAFTSKKGNEVLVAEFRVLDGPHEGVKWSVLHGFKNEKAAGVAKSFCQSARRGRGERHRDRGAQRRAEAACRLLLLGGRGAEGPVVQHVRDGPAGWQRRRPVSDVPSDDAPAHGPVDTSDVPF
jgi:hypothetical protein